MTTYRRLRWYERAWRWMRRRVAHKHQWTIRSFSKAAPHWVEYECRVCLELWRIGRG